MKVALYVGKHSGAPLGVRLGAWLTKVAQKGQFDNVTHVEAILEEHADGTYTVGSSVASFGGVRITRKSLEASEWLIVDVPQWDGSSASQWFMEHLGEPYDWRGALATVLPGHDSTGYFCNEAVGEAVGLLTPWCFTPSQFAAIACSLGTLDIQRSKL